MADFDLGRYTSSLQKEIEAFGFNVWIEKRDKAISSPILSAFLKADTRNPDALAVWSRDFFRDVADRIRFAER